MIMMVVMSFFMVWIGFSSPAGVVLFWDVSSIFGIAQQSIMQRFYKTKDKKIEEELVDITPIKVDVERRIKKPKPTKKSK